MVSEITSDTRRLTQRTLYISGSTGSDDVQTHETAAGSDSWASRFSSIFCGYFFGRKWFVSRHKMQVMVRPSLPVANGSRPETSKVVEKS